MEIESSAESGLHIKQTNRVTFITASPKPRTFSPGMKAK